MSNVFDGSHVFGGRPESKKPVRVAERGGGPQDPTMERIAKLEQRLDDMLPTLATRADMQEIRGDFHKAHVDMQRWIIGTIITLAFGFIGLILTMWNVVGGAIKPTQAAATPAPIVITVPAASPPAPAQPPAP